MAAHRDPDKMGHNFRATVKILSDEVRGVKRANSLSGWNGGPWPSRVVNAGHPKILDASKTRLCPDSFRIVRRQVLCDRLRFETGGSGSASVSV